MNELKRYIRNVLPLATVLAAFMLPGAAAADDDWHPSGKVYLWLSDTNVSTTQGQEVEAEFNDVIGDLELAFMGTLAARKDRWSWFGDVLFVAVDARDTTPVTGPGIPVPIDAELKYEQDVLAFWVVVGLCVGLSVFLVAMFRWRRWL